MALVVLKNRYSDNPADFKNSFSSPLVLGPGGFSKVALKSLSIETLPDLELTSDMTLTFEPKSTGPAIPITIPLGVQDSVAQIALTLQAAINGSMAVVNAAGPITGLSARVGFSHLVSVIPMGASGKGFRFDCCATSSKTRQTFVKADALAGGMTYGAGTLTRSAAAGAWSEWAVGDLLASRGSYQAQAQVGVGDQFFAIMPSRPLPSATAELSPEDVAAQGGVAVWYRNGNPYTVFTPDIPTGYVVPPGTINDGLTDDVIVFERTLGITAIRVVRNALVEDIGVWAHESNPWYTVSAIFSASGTQRSVLVSDDIITHPPALGSEAGYDVGLGTLVATSRSYIFSRPLATLLGFSALIKKTASAGVSSIKSDNPAQGTSDTGALVVKLPDLPIQGRSGISRSTEAFVDIVPQEEKATSGRLLYAPGQLIYSDITHARPTTINSLSVRMEALDGSLLECEGSSVVVLHFL